MRASFHRLSLPAALGGLVVLVAWPVLRAGAPTVGDGLNHFYRLAELHWAVQNGVLYPRWLPDLAYGFGLPVFNFYPPLTYWLAEVWALAGGSLPRALGAGYVVAIVTLVVGAFTWVRATLRSEVAGLAAAAAYGFAPYLFLNLVHRGAYPELWGMAIAPWVFWAVHGVARRPGGAAASRLAVALAALLLAHAASMLMVAPLALLYGLGLSGRELKGWRWLGAGALVAAGLAAVFWLPVLLEGRFVQLARLGGGMFAFGENFLSPAALFGPPRVFDPLRTFNEIAPGVNWVVLLVAAVGAWRLRGSAPVVMAALGALALAVLTLPVSRPVWEHLPLLPFIQFPWRWVGPLSLLLALPAGAGVDSLATGRRWSATVLPAFVLAAALFALPWTFGETPADLRGRTHADIPRYEIESGQLGTTSSGEFLSVWAETLPDAQTFQASYAARRLPVQRLDRARLPAGVTVLRETAYFDGVEVEYESPDSFALILNWLFFPDVRATVDGVALVAGPAPGVGLTQIASVPAGRHTLSVHSVLSRPQRWGAAVSIASLLLVLPILVHGFTRIYSGEIEREFTVHLRSSASELLVLGAAAGLILARVFWLDVRPSIFHDTRLVEGTVVGVTPQNIVFGDRIKLIGMDIHGEEVRLYWQGLAVMDTDYSIALYLQDDAGVVLAQQDSQHPGLVPTTRWTPGQYAEDLHRFTLDTAPPAGEYQIVVAVYSGDGTLEGIDADGQVGHYVSVGTLRIAD